MRADALLESLAGRVTHLPAAVQERLLRGVAERSRRTAEREEYERAQQAAAAAVAALAEAAARAEGGRAAVGVDEAQHNAARPAPNRRAAPAAWRAPPNAAASELLQHAQRTSPIRPPPGGGAATPSPSPAESRYMTSAKGVSPAGSPDAALFTEQAMLARERARQWAIDRGIALPVRSTARRRSSDPPGINPPGVSTLSPDASAAAPIESARSTAAPAWATGAAWATHGSSASR